MDDRDEEILELRKEVDRLENALADLGAFIDDALSKQIGTRGVILKLGTFRLASFRLIKVDSTGTKTLDTWEPYPHPNHETRGNWKRVDETWERKSDE